MRRKNRMLAAALLVPVFLMLLFAQLRDNRAIMDGWVYGIMGPVEQMLGRLWSPFLWLRCCAYWRWPVRLRG